MSTPLLSLRGIGRTFGEDSGVPQRALDDVSLDVFDGEFVAIVGPSGGGKTTLLSILGLLDSPSRGEYYLNGEATSTLSEAERTRLRANMIGFVFQAFHLLDRRPVLDSAELALFYQGVPRPARTERAAKALANLGLAGRGETLASNLSGGQRQPVAIARAVATDNPIILADEPTGNLDSETGAAVLAELESLNRAGATIVVVTHSDEVAGRAGRVVRIADGQLVSDAPGDRNTVSRQPGQQSSQGAVGSKLRLIDLLRDATRSVLSRRGQSAALILAVAVAVSLVVVSLGLGASARAQVSETFDARANREVTVTWDQQPGTPSLGDAVSRVAELTGVTAAAGLVDHGEVGVETRAQALAITLRGVVGDIAASTSSTVTWAGNKSRQLTGKRLSSGGHWRDSCRLRRWH